MDNIPFSKCLFKSEKGQAGINEEEGELHNRGLYMHTPAEKFTHLLQVY